MSNTHNRQEGEDLNQQKQAKRQNLKEKSENNAHQQQYREDEESIGIKLAKTPKSKI